ncbi:glycosyltransferase family 2 protein [Thioclava indica]|uniref:Glycosyltransferase 2-like domain-containing protein n=1 Tax=Thioclava indica TaxID=1353528 RepID=A0A074JTT8_9RHOB|nr:glycosyltransferase family 2 protein [Thioclava indica]KEO59889.1 hypothetical protein DT23_15610 [Thioclava indica]
MNASVKRPICVIIPAHNAAKTIAKAVRSALLQPEVGEVVVIDDASSDATSKCAQDAADGDARLTVLHQDTNIGPAAGRNVAIAHSTAPLIAILDADDYFLPGRFADMLARDDWDMIADNIVFVPDTRRDPVTRSDVEETRQKREFRLETSDFILGNIPRASAYRGELGFLKPLISRHFIERFGLKYDETLRLGEDFKFYVEMLAHGARFQVSTHVGYVALVRAESLSGRHRAADLKNLLFASRELSKMLAPDPASLKALRAYLRELKARYVLHAFLDIKRDSGSAKAFAYATQGPHVFWLIARGVLRDKIAAALKKNKRPTEAKRYLLPME